MELHIRGKDIAVGDDLRAFAERRTAKFEHRLSRIDDANLELRRRHNRSGPDSTTAQLTIQTGRRILRAEEDDSDPFVAVDRAVDKLTRQIRRFHDKRADRKGPRPTAAPLPELDGVDGAVEPVDEEDEEARAVVVRTKRFSVKPMDVEEAIDQMELLGHDFFLFHNADEAQLNVLYRRRDGSYGLLAPEPR